MSAEEEHFLYILYSDRIDRYYIGVSHNPGMRLAYHNTSAKGWTRRGRPWRLLFKRPLPSRSNAARWEKWIKKQKRRDVIERIVTGKLDGG